MNVEEPVALKNIHDFNHKDVKKAAKLISKWFHDAELGWCRVLRLGGSNNEVGMVEPTMHYTYLDSAGAVMQDSSSLAEVAFWVLQEPTNV